MSAAITCTSCNRPLRVPESVLGQTVQCPLCLDEFIAQADPAAEAAARAAEPPRRAAARQQPVAVAAQAEFGAEQAPLAEIIDDVPAEMPPILEAVPEPAAAPRGGPKRAFVFPVMVSRDPDRILRGPMDGELTAEGLYLRKIRQPPTFAAVGGRARYLGTNRLIVTVEGREVELAVTKPRAATYHLARDTAAFLNGKGPFPNARSYTLPWYLYAIPLLFIALPFAAAPFGLITDGCLGVFLWAVIALALAGVSLILATQSRLRPRARLIGAACVLGFGALLPFLTIPVSPTYTVDSTLWTSYTPAAGDFTVLMPGSPATSGTMNNQVNGAKRYTLDVANPEIHFAVLVAPASRANNGFPNAFGGGSATEQDYNNAKDLLATEFSLKSVYMTFYPIERNGYRGQAYREYSYQIPSSGYGYTGSAYAGKSLAARVYVVNGEVVTLAAVGPRVKLDGPDVVKFFNSIQFTTPSGPKAPPQPTDVDPNALLAYWSFDLDQGGRFVDESGNNVFGRAQNVPTIIPDGKRGNAMRFNGRSYFAFNDAPGLNFADHQEFTFCGWFRTGAAQGVILSNRNTGDSGSIIELTLENGLPTALVRQDRAANFQAGLTLRGTKTVNDGAWHHFALTRRGFTAAVGLYIDGALQGQEQQGAVSSGSIDTNLRALGARQNPNGLAPNLTFSGDVDEFCVFNRALGAGQISRLAGAGP